MRDARDVESFYSLIFSSELPRDCGFESETGLYCVILFRRL